MIKFDDTEAIISPKGFGEMSGRRPKIAKDFYARILADPEWNAIMERIDDPENIDRSKPAAKNGSYHGMHHARAVDAGAEEFLREMGADEETIFLAKIAALLHDVGVYVDEENHEKESAVFAREYLKSSGLSERQQAIILHAIGDHRKGEGMSNLVDAAVLLADKLDVTKRRIRPEAKNLDPVNQDLTKISKVSLDISDANLDLHYETDDGYVPKNLFTLWPKAIEIPRKVAKFIRRDFRLFINGRLYSTEDDRA